MHIWSGWGSTGEYSSNKLQEAQVLLKDIPDNKESKRVVQALGATKHGTILSFFQKATPPHPPLPSPKQISTADPSTCCNTYP